MLAASPMGPTIEAVRVGTPLPRLPEDAATWVDPRTGLESLTIAAWLRCPSLARTLLAAGAPVDGPEGAEATPAMRAAAITEWEVVGVLLDAGADPLRGGGSPGTSVISQASAFGEVGVMRRILDDVDVPASTPALEEALVTATAVGRVESVEVLLGAGVEPTVTALVFAAEASQERELFQVLIAAAAGVDYTGAATGAERSHLEAICAKLSQPGHPPTYRPESLLRLAQVLGKELPCHDD